MKKRENTGKIIGKVFGEARALGVTTLAAAVMLSGCGNAGNQAQKGGSGAEQTENVENGEKAAENTQTSVIIAMPPTSEPEAGFDPAYGWGAGEHMHEPLIQSTLTVTEADLSIGYDLATDVETSEDGMTWTVTIRDDKIVAITDITGDGDSSNDRYITKAANGTSSIKGVVSQIIDKGMPEDIDTVSRATCSSNAILEGCKKVLEAAERPTDTEAE